MNINHPTRCRLSLLLILASAAAISGCARLPRIDPTGQRFLIWPGDQPTAVAIGAPGTVPTAVATTAPPGNVAVAPVYSSSTTGVQALNPFARQTAAAQPGQERVQLSPQRVLAPVGSEVVLRAGVCARGGRLLANQRLEWLVGREGAGQIVSVGNGGLSDLTRFPWDWAKKVDNSYATSWTNNYPVCLRRGTPDPSDDLKVERGEGWISITSPVEGTSYITAYAPVVDNWNGRQATATIYWIDAQWVFPSSTVVETGRSHVLTTTITRRSDGAPVTGYVVRYEIAGTGGATLGYDAGRSVDVPINAQGRASVEVSPTDASGGVATINMSIIRPPSAGFAAGPQVELGRSSATITWGPVRAAPAPVATPALVPGSVAPGQLSPTPIEPRPSLGGPTPAVPDSNSRPPADTFAPPADEPAAGRPNLEVRIVNQGADRVQVGQFVRFEVIAANGGDGVARNLLIRDEFEAGLSFPAAEPGSNAVENRTLGNLEPGQSKSLFMSFEMLRSGEWCHEVTVSADGANEAFDRACVTGVEAPPTVQPTLNVQIVAPARKFVGEVDSFRISIANTGEVPVTNLEVTNEFDSAMEALRTKFEHKQVSDGRILWEFPRLDVGETIRIPVEYRFVADSRSACSRVFVSADNDVVYADEGCVEIAPPLNSPALGAPGQSQSLPADAGGIAPPGTAAPPPADLRLAIAESAVQPQEGSRITMTVTLSNVGQQSIRDVAVRVVFPAELEPDQNFISAQVGVTAVGRELRFNPVGEIRPNETLRFVIPTSVNRVGTATVRAEALARGTQSITVESQPIQVRPRTL